MKTKLLLVRHRESVKNVLNICDCIDYEKYDLSEKGFLESQKLFENLKDIKIDIIYSSPFKRCISTIEKISKEKKLNIIFDTRLKETYTPDLEGLNSLNWKPGFNDIKHYGGESIIDIYDRMIDFLKEIVGKNKGKTILICSHGEPIFLLKKYLDDKYKNIDIYQEEIKNKLYPSKESFDLIEIDSETLKVI